MKIGGDGIGSAVTLEVTQFEPKTQYALTWAKSASGNWYASDRGAASDIYETTVAVHGLEYKISNIMDAIEANRDNPSNTVTLSYFNGVDDRIFGADLDYTSTVSATILKMEPMTQKSWKGFGTKLTLRALSPSFTGSATFPALLHQLRGYEADANYTVSKADSYTGGYYYHDEDYDAGEFSGTFMMTTAEITNLRRYAATQRGTSFTVTDIPGVLQPWGPRRGTYNMTCKLKEVDDRGMRDKNYWTVKITLVEQVAET